MGNKSKGIVAKAAGINPNPFFRLAEIKEPLISEKATLAPLQLKKIFEYDLPTKAGASYVLEF
jgi:alpha-L-fucosidase 2